MTRLDNYINKKLNEGKIIFYIETPYLRRISFKKKHKKMTHFYYIGKYAIGNDNVKRK